MANKEWIVDVVLLAIGVLFIIESFRLGIGSVNRPGSGLLPLYASLALSFTALFALVRCLFASPGEPERKKFFGQSIGTAVAILMGLVAYVFLFPWLGYAVSTLILMMFLFRIAGFREWRRIILLGIITTSSSYLLFNYWLHLRLPKGFFGF